MNTAWMELAAGRGALGIGLVVAGVVVVGLLLGAFVLGFRAKRRELPTPRPEEQPRMPAGGPVRETRERREPDEVPRSEDRLTPHQLKGHGNQGDRTSASQERPRWNEGSSGSFGSGGAGGR
ncbi:DUF6479 family protein [Streptomyces lomondensis]|uniref:Secreted protein n=1 Tax=Streptomyces lomondensis TaxID=68229 RepID=A0ABQ2XTZ1_9ACTN|nr:DUF6479 family protein [Streptomyces lomondensis]MCF0083038.1 DUF6479 family protein [Streptomyces lomondensis]GGX31892.1 hypothetical protein GCM10010383_72680 [Streptomyces lomondensis]